MKKTSANASKPAPPRDTDMALLPHDRSHHEEELRRETNARYQYMLGPDGYRNAMDRIARLADERGIAVVILVLGADKDSRALIREAAQKHGFPILDAAPHCAEYMRGEGIQTTREAWRNLFQIPDHGHPSALAHRLYAEVLARFFGEPGGGSQPALRGFSPHIESEPFRKSVFPR